MWAPKRWDLSLTALSQYTTPLVPPESTWVDQSKRPSTLDLPAQGAEPPVMLKRKCPAARRIMRHVLRARGEAVRALASFFAALEDAGEDKQVVASAHLARRFGWVDEVKVDMEAQRQGPVEVEVQGYRHAREVISFLRSRGAKIATLEREIEGGWAGALVSEEGTPAESEAGEGEGEEDDTVWVAGEARPTGRAASMN